MHYSQNYISWVDLYNYKLRRITVRPTQDDLDRAFFMMWFSHPDVGCLPDITVDAVVSLNKMTTIIMHDNIDEITSNGIFVIDGIQYFIRRVSWTYMKSLLKKFKS